MSKMVISHSRNILFAEQNARGAPFAWGKTGRNLVEQSVVHLSIMPKRLSSRHGAGQLFKKRAKTRPCDEKVNLVAFQRMDCCLANKSERGDCNSH